MFKGAPDQHVTPAILLSLYNAFFVLPYKCLLLLACCFAFDFSSPPIQVWFFPHNLSSSQPVRSQKITFCLSMTRQQFFVSKSWQVPVDAFSGLGQYFCSGHFDCHLMVRDFIPFGSLLLLQQMNLVCWLVIASTLVTGDLIFMQMLYL